MKKIKTAFVLVIFMLVAGCGAGNTVLLKSRPNVTQNYLWIPAEKAVATVVLFAGGGGYIKLTSGGSINNLPNNFLIRTRNLFASENLNVAVFEAPSDRQRKKGMVGGFRSSQDHVADVAAVIDDIKKKSTAPVWLIGHSRGSESAAYNGIHNIDKINGIVLLSSVTKANGGGVEVTAMELDKITVPVFIAAHENDACWVTPPAGAENIKSMLTGSSNVKVVMFNGGSSAVSGPCKSKSEHGFYGLDDQVIKQIADFIRSA